MNGHIERCESKLTGKVSWKVRLYVDAAHGGPKRKSGGTYPLERQASAALHAILARYHEGTYHEPSTMTVAQLCERWLRDAAEPKSR